MMSPWLARADLLSSENRTREALAALARALRSEGPRAEIYVRRGRIHHRNGRYRLALRDMGRAVSLSNRDADLRLERSLMLSLDGRFAEARREAARAVSLRPEDDKARLVLIRLLIRDGRLSLAAREIAAILRSGSPHARSEALFCRGLLALRRGRSTTAAIEFRGLFKDPERDGNLAERARFYWIACKAAGASVDARDKRSSDGPRLLFCGLGLFPPYSATLEVLRALPRCDVIVNNISEIETRELLDALGPGVRCVTYRDGGNERFVLRSIFRELRQGRTAAFVTRGHPMIFGTLGRLLAERCRKTGIPFEIFSAVSSIDTLLARAGAALGSPARAIQAFDCAIAAKASALDVGQPLIISFNRERLPTRGVMRLQTTLRRFYPAGHACWMFGPRYDDVPRTVILRDLLGAYPEVDPSLMLYVPALPGGTRDE